MILELCGCYGVPGYRGFRKIVQFEGDGGGGWWCLLKTICESNKCVICFKLKRKSNAFFAVGFHNVHTGKCYMHATCREILE